MNEEEALAFLADRYARRIISATARKERSARELSSSLGIPQATVYRKLKQLEEHGMIKHVKSVINTKGKEEKFYRCRLKSLSVIYRDGKLSIEFVEEDLSDRLVRLWKTLSHQR